MIFLKTAKFMSANENSVNFSVDGETLLKIQILEAKIFRISLKKNEWVLNKTWSIAPGLEDLDVAGRSRNSIEGFSCPRFQVRHQENLSEIESDSLLLKVELSPFRLKWFDKATGIEIHTDRTKQAYAINSGGWNHYSARGEKDFYFGLGEKTGSILRNERRFEMRNVDAMDYDPDLTDPMYKHIPFYICQKPEVAYGIFYDNMSQCVFNMGAERENYYGLFTSYQVSEGDLDYYFILGPTLKQVTKTFSWMTGKTLFAPLHSLRYSGSTMGYTEGAKPQTAISDFLSRCVKHDIPVGSFQLSSGYCMHGKLRHVFVWNRDKFPDFSKLSEQAQKQKVEFSANIKPVLFNEHPEYESLKNQGLLIQANGKPESSYFWDEFASHLDFSMEATRNWWKGKIKSELFTQGINSTWNDNNEFHIVNPSAEIRGFEKPIPVSQVRPVLSLLMCQTSFQAHREHDLLARPWLITRAGGPGMQRYAQTWTGDNRTSWRSLKMNLQTGMGLSLSGIYNWGIDVGGFSGPVPEPELFVRWIQQGIFYPRFTIHSWKADGTVTEPWMYPEFLPSIRAAMKIREKFLPYLYQQFYLAHRDQEPILRPLIWEEVSEKTMKFSDQFYLGDRIMVCPIVKPKVNKYHIYLPKHSGGWWNYFTKKWHKGDQVIELPADISSIFVFVKGNSVIPLNNSEGGQTLCFFGAPSDMAEKWEYFFDDGISFAYQKNQFFSLKGTIRSNAQKMQLSVQHSGQWLPDFKAFKIRIYAAENCQVSINNSAMKNLALAAISGFLPKS